MDTGRFCLLWAYSPHLRGSARRGRLAPVTDINVRRLDFGYFIRPAAETGTGTPRVEPCLGYLVEHPDGLLLVDTGMGADPDVDAHYRPHRVPLPVALKAAGARPDDVRHVVNCHLHFDHSGGNPDLPAGRSTPSGWSSTSPGPSRTTRCPG